MKIEEGKVYCTENGHAVKVRKNSLPYYCFSASEVDGKSDACFRETWTAEGKAYHDDCGYNFVREV